MNRSNLLVLAALVAVILCLVGTTAQSQVGPAKSFVHLQSSTPGTSQSGHANIAGSMRANQFIGSGTSLTGLNASNISSGTLADGRLSANVARRDTGNSFAGNIVMGAGSQFFFDPGTMADPSISFTGDNDTGLCLLSSDKMVLVTGGLGRMVVSDNGFVGIGTSNPGVRLDVNGQIFAKETSQGQEAALHARNGNTNLTWNNDGSHAVRGEADAVGSGYAIGVEGMATASTNPSRTAYGVYGLVAGESGSNQVFGVFGQVAGGDASSFAGYFLGRLGASIKLFQIDHPLDPANKFLNHSCVESDEMKNVYDGVAFCDSKGEAWISMPNWFEALNGQFRYQLTCIGGYAPVYISQKLQNGRFKIAGGSPGLEVSWQVTGVRKDAYAQANPLVVEEAKKGFARGKYLHPELFGGDDRDAISPSRMKTSSAPR